MAFQQFSRTFADREATAFLRCQRTLYSNYAIILNLNMPYSAISISTLSLGSRSGNPYFLCVRLTQPISFRT